MRVEKHPRIHKHFTPTLGAVWNVVERSIRHIIEKCLRPAAITNILESARLIEECVAKHGTDPKSLEPTKKPGTLVRNQYERT